MADRSVREGGAEGMPLEGVHSSADDYATGLPPAAAAGPLGKSGHGGAASEAFVYTDPSGHYTRSDKVWSRSKAKVVYRAFDRMRGLEVAWNKVQIGDSPSGERRKRLEAHVNMLLALDHENIVGFHTAWFDEDMKAINFITDFCDPGPLRRYWRSHKMLPQNLLKQWAWQILQGLLYLHMQEPPIIHKELKYDNIFMDEMTGVLKIGDLGFSKLTEGGLSRYRSSFGGLEIKAPELYSGNYDEKVDIYAYGMVLLEIAAMEFPYRECTNDAELFDQISSGILPASLAKVQDPETRMLIEMCIQLSPEMRPSAKQLAEHSYFDDIHLDRLETMQLNEQNRVHSIDDRYEERFSISREDCLRVKSVAHLSGVSFISDISRFSDFTDMGLDGNDDTEENEPDFLVQQLSIKGTCVDFNLEFTTARHGTRTFVFTFDVELDSVEAVASELQEEFRLTESETSAFMRLLRDEVLSLHIRPQSGGKEDVGMEDVEREDVRIEDSGKEDSVKEDYEKDCDVVEDLGVVDEGFRDDGGKEDESNHRINLTANIDNSLDWENAKILCDSSRSAEFSKHLPPAQDAFPDIVNRDQKEYKAKTFKSSTLAIQYHGYSHHDSIVMCKDLDTVWFVSKKADQTPFIRTVPVDDFRGQVLTVPEGASVSRLSIGRQEGQDEQKVLMVQVDSDAPQLFRAGQQVMQRNGIASFNGGQQLSREAREESSWSQCWSPVTRLFATLCSPFRGQSVQRNNQPIPVATPANSRY